MRLRTIGTARVSGLCIGGNPFSGFSHQGSERNRQMLEYHTPERIHATLREAAEKLSMGSFHALPVVDRKRRLHGIVTSSDIIGELLRRLAG